MSLWETRDLPVLTALRRAEQHGEPSLALLQLSGDGAQSLGLQLNDASLALSLLALEDVGYLAIEQVGHTTNMLYSHMVNVRTTGRGLAVLGEWPLFEAITSPATLAAALDRLAEIAPTVEERGSLGQAGTFVRNVGATALRAAVAAAISHTAKGAIGL